MQVLEKSNTCIFLFPFCTTLAPLFGTHYIILQNPDHLYDNLPLNKICFRNIMFAKHNNELRWKASMLPFAKGKEIVPVIFAKNVSNQSDTAIVITPKDIIDLMK